MKGCLFSHASSRCTPFAFFHVRGRYSGVIHVSFMGSALMHSWCPHNHALRPSSRFKHGSQSRFHSSQARFHSWLSITFPFRGPIARPFMGPNHASIHRSQSRCHSWVLTTLLFTGPNHAYKVHGYHTRFIFRVSITFQNSNHTPFMNPKSRLYRLMWGIS